jgi:hypothetical protein
MRSLGDQSQVPGSNPGGRTVKLLIDRALADGLTS